MKKIILVFIVCIMCIGQPAHTQEKVALRVGYVPLLTQLPLVVSYENDHLNFLQVDLDLIKYTSFTSLEAALRVGAIDAAIASQTAGLAAESMGLGFCYIGAIRNHPRQVISLFQLPELVFPVFGMTLGWPVEAPLIRPRLPLKAILHKETYQQDDLVLMKEYDQEMIDTGIYRNRQVGREDQDPADYGWMEHSARRVSKPSRPGLKETIVEAGFALK